MMLRIVAFVLLLLGAFQQVNAQINVAAGQSLYRNTNTWGGASTQCSSCHFLNLAPDVDAQGSNHPQASNNLTLIKTAFATGGLMVGQFGNAAFTMSDDDAYRLALFIGQYKVPVPGNGNRATRSGASVTFDANTTLSTNGSSGVPSDAGVSAAVSTNGITPSVAITNTRPRQYNLTYNPGAYVGNDAFTYTLTNGTGSANATVNVVSYGVSNNTLTATAFKGVNSANVYTIQSNDPAATFTASGLAGTGLSLAAGSGVISGTPNTTGTLNIAIGVNVNSAGANNGASATKTLVLTLAGITSAATANYFQNTAIPPYTVTAFPSAGAVYSIASGALPAGLSFAGNQITGTPTAAGSFQVILQANTSAGVVTQPLDITVGPVPVVSTAPPIPAAPTLYVAGTTGTAITPIQINATNPPISAYSAAGLASAVGLSLSPGGQISGIPTVSGDFPVTLGATNSNGQGTLNVILRINSNVAPNITSGPAAAAVPLGAFSANVYTVTANNGPITGYAVVAPSTLPPGLAISPTTGVVSGTPTASGLFSTTLSATNSGNLTGSRVVTFTINPVVAPVITSPTFAALAVGVPITPIQVVATNPPILSYGGGNTLPAGLVLDTVTGIISGTPTTPGPVTATLTATNVVNTGQLAVTFTIGVPPPSACTMTVPLNTPTTLDLRPCMFPAYTPTGVSILATPAHGSVSVSGTNVTFTPVNNYFGTDSFTAVAYFTGGGTTTPGLVQITVTGRPDPTQDPTVAALVTAQADTAQRFARAQISNYQRRMESLHQRTENGAPALALQPRTGAVTNQSVAAAQGAAPATSVTRAVSPSVFESARTMGLVEAAAGAAPVAISQAQALDVVATGVGLKSLPFAEAVTQLLTTNAVNMANLVPSGGAPAPGATSYWVEGVASFGNKDATAASGAYDFSSSGITFGADRRISDKLVVGLGLGYGRDKTRIGTDGSENDGRGLSLAAYASYAPAPGSFIDGMLGFGNIEFDTRRYVVPINDFALGNRKGTQVFGSLTGGFEFRNNGVMFSPYARIDYSAERLQDSTENGAGAFALTYFDQTSSSLQGALGARAESIHSTNFGWVIPRARVEMRHEFQSDRQAFISYADQIGGPRYGLVTPGSGRDALVLGLGSDFIMRDGWTLGIDYQLTQTFGQASSYALQFKLTKDFDAKGLPRLVGNYLEEASKPLDIQVDAGFMMDDNVTRAKAGPDKLSDNIYSVNVSKSEVYTLSDNSRFVLSGALGGERFQNFNGLSRISAGLEGEYQYRGSSEFDAPTFGLFGKITAERYQSYLRNGYRTSLGVSVRQPLTDKISLFGALASNQRFGNSAVFNTSETALRLNADYALSDRETLYATGEFRFGDIVSTGQASLENVSVAKVFVQDDAYPGGQFFSYKLEGRTVLATIGYNLGLGPRDSLDFSWRHVRSTPSLRPAFVTSPNSYIANQWAITYLVRF